MYYREPLSLGPDRKLLRAGPGLFLPDVSWVTR